MKDKKIENAENKILLEEMKKFFKVNSIEEVALKMGYKENTATTWRSRGVSKAAKNKFDLMKSNDYIEKTQKNTVKNIETNQVSIFHYENIMASAGGGAYTVDENKTSVMSFDAEFLKARLGITDYKNIHTITAFGDSMQPTINNGDLLFVLPFENEHNTIKDGAVYVLNCDNSVFVKRVKMNPVKKTITLISDNSEYEQIKIEGDELDSCNIIGRVVVYMGLA